MTKRTILATQLKRLRLQSTIADKAILTAVTLTAYVDGRNVPAILLDIKDGLNNDPSFHYLTMAQAAVLRDWLTEQLA